MKIGDIVFENNLILAPMAGISDVAFRSICIEFGADCGFSEMVSAKALHYNNEKTIDLLATAPNERIKIVQIFGSDADIMSQIVSSQMLQKFDIIDINMGCPAPKIVGNGEGSALLKDISKAEHIISSCVKASSKPITVKFRSGYNSSNIIAVQFAQMCQRAGASAITIHGRTREQMYGGKVDLQVIRAVKDAVSIPVIASGDVTDEQSYKDTLLQTGCDAVMIGRGALGSPEIFARLLGQKVHMSKYQTIVKHIKYLRQIYPDQFVTKHMRKHLLWYLKGYPNASTIKSQVSTMENIDDVLMLLREFFDKNQ